MQNITSFHPFWICHWLVSYKDTEFWCQRTNNANNRSQLTFFTSLPTPGDGTDPTDVNTFPPSGCWEVYSGHKDMQCFAWTVPGEAVGSNGVAACWEHLTTSFESIGMKEGLSQPQTCGARQPSGVQIRGEHCYRYTFPGSGDLESSISKCEK